MWIVVHFSLIFRSLVSSQLFHALFEYLHNFVFVKIIAILAAEGFFGLLLGLHESASQDVNHGVAFVDFDLNECFNLVHDLRVIEYVLRVQKVVQESADALLITYL